MEIQLQRSGFWSSIFGVTLRKITGVEKRYADQFRIVKQVLVDGEERFYPEYRLPGFS